MAELKRHMGLFHLTMYGVGLILGAGIYVLIGEAAGFAGNSVWLAFVFGSVVAVLTGLGYSELTALFPKAAAEYVFVKNAFKNDFIAFLIGWLTALTSMITAATVALGFGGYFVQFLNIPITISAVLILGVLSFVNFVGIRESAWTNTIFALITVAGLALIIFMGFTLSDPKPIDYFESPTGINGLVIAFVLIFFAFIGFEDMANVAEEVKKPHRNLPRSILLSILITGVIYVLVSISSVRILDWQELAASSAPLASVAEKVLGYGGNITLSAIALFATASTVLITLIAGARILYGMAREKSLPSFLSKVHYKTKTPWIAVVGIMLTSIAFALVGDIVIVANIAVFAIVVTFAMVNLAVIVLRYTEPEIKRPFRVPLNVKKFPILPLIGFALSIYMGLQFDAVVMAVGFGIIGTGAIFYLIYNQGKIRKL